VVRAGRPAPLLVIGISLVAVLALAHRGEIRDRAEAALGAGMPPREAALARGFVLGEDDGVDAGTVEDFRRAGLGHLLAVSGQNVALLALLAMPLLAAFGVPLRTRLVWVVAAIAVYVPLAGGGPSIVRAGVMGGLGLLATLAGRRSSRLYALAIAAIVTLALDPGIGGDVGWQLSFAAVLGILVLAPPLRAAVSARLGDGGWRGAVADGIVMTLAATVATAPLVSFHFGALSTTTLVANLVVLPAVAPAMWLGMLAGAAGQVPGFPVSVINAIAAPLLAYIAQVAFWCGGPSWAYVHLRLGATGLLASYLALLAAAIGAPPLLRARRLRALRRREPAAGRPISGRARAFSAGGRRWIGAGACAVVALAAVLAWEGSATEAAEPIAGLRVSFLDVGQGDAILLQPAGAPAILVDGGPPGDGLAAKLRAAGVSELAVAAVTHEQSDHAGGIEELLGSFPVARLAYARLSRRLRGGARRAGAVPVRMAAGDSIRSGRLRLEALWPPRELLGAPLGGADPNAQALVFLARWRDFSMLLTADAEAEAVPLDPGPVDVLKVAHHGSDDPGLDALLARTAPRLAVISVGAGNPFGHPTPTTLATLGARGVRVMRIDRDGAVTLDVRPGSVKVRTDG
jgi:competence protein ComEC